MCPLCINRISVSCLCTKQDFFSRASFVNSHLCCKLLSSDKSANVSSNSSHNFFNYIFIILYGEYDTRSLFNLCMQVCMRMCVHASAHFVVVCMRDFIFFKFLTMNFRCCLSSLIYSRKQTTLFEVFDFKDWCSQKCRPQCSCGCMYVHIHALNDNFVGSCTKYILSYLRLFFLVLYCQYFIKFGLSSHRFCFIIFIMHCRWA